MSKLSIADRIAAVADNCDSLEISEAALTSAQTEALAKALETNTNVTNVNLENKGIELHGGLAMAEMLKVNKTLKTLDLGYNSLPSEAIVALGEAMKVNTTLETLKIHRQAKDYGSSAEEALVTLWTVNTTMTRLYATLHDRRCNQTNTAGEVRNKEIQRRIEAGKSWDELNPDPVVKAAYQAKQEQERKEAAAAAAAANAPISEKVASTGGPYTLKQLTCNSEFLPDDIDKGNKETHLSDEEFESVFKMSKSDFEALPKWKRANKKKELKLH